MFSGFSPKDFSKETRPGLLRFKDSAILGMTDVSGLTDRRVDIRVREFWGRSHGMN